MADSDNYSIDIIIISAVNGEGDGGGGGCHDIIIINNYYHRTLQCTKCQISHEVKSTNCQ